MKKTTKILIAVVALCVIVAAGVGIQYLVTPHEEEIDKTYAGILLFEGETEPKKCTVELKGKYIKQMKEPEEQFIGQLEEGLFIEGKRVLDVSVIFSNNEDCEYSVVKGNADIALKKDFSTFILKFRYDTEKGAPVEAELNENNQMEIPKDKGVECLLVVPAENIEDAKKQIEAFRTAPGANADWAADFKLDAYVTRFHYA